MKEVFKISWWKSLLPLIFIIFFGYFIYDQRGEWESLRSVISQANVLVLLVSAGVLAYFCVLQGHVYSAAFGAIGKSIPLVKTVPLYLKRYFLSTFIPAGFTVSQYAFTRDLKSEQISGPESHLASTLYLLSAAISYVLLLIPTLVWLLFSRRLTPAEWYAGVIVVLVIIFLLIEFLSLFQPQKGLVHRTVDRFFPDAADFFDAWQKHTISISVLVKLVAMGIIVQGVSMLLLWMVFAALHVPASFFIILVGYVVTMLVLILSPVFQGIGLVEYSLVFTLEQLGILHQQAVAVALLFRLFQLWLPLAVGLGFVLHQRFVRKDK